MFEVDGTLVEDVVAKREEEDAPKGRENQVLARHVVDPGFFGWCIPWVASSVEYRTMLLLGGRPPVFYGPSVNDVFDDAGFFGQRLKHMCFHGLI
jgi:hypothetical protein